MEYTEAELVIYTPEWQAGYEAYWAGRPKPKASVQAWGWNKARMDDQLVSEND